MSQTEALEVTQPDEVADGRPAQAATAANLDLIDRKVAEVFGRGGGGDDGGAVGAPAADDGDGGSPCTGEPAGSQSAQPQEAGKADAAPPEPAADEPEAFTDRQVNAIRKFGFNDRDLTVLQSMGEKGRQFSQRLVKVESELGRRYSLIGRAERMLRQEPPGAGTAAGPAVSPAADAGTGINASSAMPGGETAAPAAGAKAASTGAPEEIVQFRRELDRLSRDVQEAGALYQTSMAERFFEQLDPEVYAEFGAGAAGEIAADSPAASRRNELLTKAAEIRRGYDLVHGRAMDFQESLRQGLSVVAADARATAQRKSLTRDLQRRQRQQIARASQRRTAGSLGSPQELARQALTDWEKSRGVRFFTE